MTSRIALVFAAVIVALFPMPADVIEGTYSTGAYPPLQRWLTALSNKTFFALLDGLIIVVVVFWLLLLLADIRSRKDAGYLWVVREAAARTVTLAAGLYLVFMAMWGLHYRREPLHAKLGFDRDRVTPVAQADLVALAVAELNRLYRPDRNPIVGPPTDRQPIDPSLAFAFEEAQRQIGVAPLATPGRPKRSLLLDWYFGRASVDGMTDPYFLETIVMSRLLPVEQPMIVAHEWAHLSGYADEGEANFVGWLTCLRGSNDVRYSGWLFLYAEAIAGLAPDDQVRVAAQLGPGPRADLSAIRARVMTSASPAISAAGWTAYDRYLKMNRVERGTESYADVIRLILGTPVGARAIATRPGQPVPAAGDVNRNGRRVRRPASEAGR